MSNGMVVIFLLVTVVVVGVYLLTPFPPEASFEIDPRQSEYHAPVTLTFTDTSQARGGALVRWRWDFGDGSEPVTDKNSCTHTFIVPDDEPRKFTITLTVWNRGGRSAQTSRTITVRPAQKPYVRSVLSDPPLEKLTGVRAPITVSFEAFATQEGEPHISVPDNGYVWTLTRLTSPTPTGRAGEIRKIGKVVTFDIVQEGEYNLLLQVTNTGGRSDTWSRKLVVFAPEKAVIQSMTLSKSTGPYPLETVLAFSATHPNIVLVGHERLRLKYEVDWGDGTGKPAASLPMPGREERLAKTYEAPGQYIVTVRVFSELLRDKTVAEETRRVEVKYHVHYLMPAWSPDFRKIAFVYRDDSRPMFYEIRLATLEVQLERGEWRILNPVFSETTLFKRGGASKATNILPSWAPGGQVLVMMSDVDGQANPDLYRIDDRDKSTRLTWLGTAAAAMPVWMPAPNDRYILFASNRDQRDTREVYSLPGVAEKMPPGDPTPSIDLVGIYELYRLDTVSGGISRLTYSSYSHRWPTVSPDGKRVAFEMREDIYLASLAAPDSDVALAVGSPYRETYPRWNPRFSNLIAFVRFRGDRWEAWICDLGTRSETPVSPEETSDVLYPSWSPDGRYLVCQKKEPDGWRLVVYEVADAKGQLLRGERITLSPSR